MAIECESETCSVFMYTVLPLLGNVAAIACYVAPMPAVYRIQKYLYTDGDLVSDSKATTPIMINPLPYAFQMGSCLSWSFYAFIQQNWYIFVPNTAGFLLSIYYQFVLISYGTWLV